MIAQGLRWEFAKHGLVWAENFDKCQKPQRDHRMSIDQQAKAMKNMASAATVVRAFSASEANQAMTMMLDALVESYKLDLMHVSADGLTHLQAAIRQTLTIRATVADESQDLPKI